MKDVYGRDLDVGSKVDIIQEPIGTITVVSIDEASGTVTLEDSGGLYRATVSWSMIRALTR